MTKEAKKTSTGVKDAPTISVESDGAKPRSTPKSGRWWKQVQTQKASMGGLKSRKKALKKSWARKVEERNKMKEVKALEAELKELKRKELEEQKEKMLAKRKRKAEAEFKNSKFQVIHNHNKIKKMSKKQLRMLKRTSVDKEGNIKLVGAYQ